MSRPIRASRRRTTWTTLDSNVSLTAGNGTNADIWATTLELAGGVYIGTTVLRTLLSLHIRNWNAVADQLLVGLIVDDKSLVGTTTPLAPDSNRDWMFYTKLFPHSSGAAVSVSEFFPTTAAPYDIRSRRVNKDLGRTSILALYNQSPVSSLTVDIFVRQLVALP